MLSRSDYKGNLIGKLSNTILVEGGTPDVDLTNYPTKEEVDIELNKKATIENQPTTVASAVPVPDGHLVIKGNIYTTKDGIRPTHFGPPTKDAGNILMPYARTVGGFTKDGSSVRTIGFVAKPIDIFGSKAIIEIPEPTLDEMTAEEMEIDSVFLGTNVSQLFLYSKTKYPTIVSENTQSPIATQQWVMDLIYSLDLNQGVQQKPLVTSKIPTELFDVPLTESKYTGVGEYQLNDETGEVSSRNTTSSSRITLIGKPQYNDINMIINDNAQIFGFWYNSEKLYTARFMGKTLATYEWSYDGSFKSISSMSLPISTDMGDRVRMIYDNVLESWVIYQFDEVNQEYILVTKISKYLFSGATNFTNEDTIPMFSAILFNQATSFGKDFQLVEAPTIPAPDRK